MTGRNRWILGSIVLLSCCWACDPGTARGLWEASRMPETLDHSHLPQDSLSSTVLAEGDEFAWPWGILPLDSVVILTDRPWLEGAVHVLDAATGDRLMVFGRKGKGPGEYSSMPAPVRCPGAPPDQFWLYDFGNQRLTQVDLRRDETEDFDEVQSRGIPSASVPRGIAFLSDSLAVITGYFQNGRVVLWDWRDGSLSPLGDLPAWESEMPPIVLQEAFQGPLVASPSGRRFALASEKTGRIELYSLTAGYLGLAKVPFEWSPDFVLESRGGQYFPQDGFLNRSAYVDLSATEERLYALFSGRSEFHFRGDMEQAEFIHEFDWDGNLITVHVLDRPVEHIAVDPVRGRILATVRDPVPGLVSFPFPYEGT